MHAAAKYFVPEHRTTVVLKGKNAERKKPPKPLAVSQSQSTNLLPESLCVLLPVQNDPTICFRLWFCVGSQNDPSGKEGLAAITAAMIAQGATQSNSYEQILDKLFPLAAGYSESTSVEMTVFSGRVHKDNVDRFYPLLIEAILHPAFKQEDLDRIKSQTLNYLQNTLHYSSDEELGKAVLYEMIFAGSPYGHLPAGTVEAVRGITLDDVKNFYRRSITPAAMLVIGLGGGYDAAMLEKLRHDLAALPVSASTHGAVFHPGDRVTLFKKDGIVTAMRTWAVPIHGRHVTIVEKDCNATAISMGFPIERASRLEGLVRPGAGQLLVRAASQSERASVSGDPRGPRAELRRLLVHRALSRTAADGWCRRRTSAAASRSSRYGFGRCRMPPGISRFGPPCGSSRSSSITA